MSGEFIAIFMASFVTFFVLIDAPGVAPVFASLTARGPASYRRLMAIRSVLVGTLIIFGFAFFGAWLLKQLHITIDAFRAAGGVLLFLIALDMVFEKRTERREDRAEDVLEEVEDPEDISVFPMGIPMIAGPGTMASLLLLMKGNDVGPAGEISVLVALAAVLLITLISFLLAGVLIKLMGKSFTNVLTRVLGVLLATLAAQFVIDGVRGALF